MKRYCPLCEKITRIKTSNEQYKGGDNPTIMYYRVFECQECGGGFFNHGYFRNPTLRNARRKKWK